MKPLSFAIALLVPVLLRAQDLGLTRFEAATVTASPQRLTVGLMSPASPDRFRRQNISLSPLLVYAYEMAEFQIIGGPDWIRTTRFDVEAKAESKPTAEQMRVMVRRLLADRFALKSHIETRDLPRYLLVKSRQDGRLGEKLRASAVDCQAIVAARGPDYRSPTGPPQPGDPPRCAPLSIRTSGARMTMIVEGRRIPEFARLLQPNAGRVIVDRTGLSGTYDIELETEMPNRSDLPAPPGGVLVPGDGLTLFPALQEQLGLKLEPDRGPVEVLVIDYAELPGPN